MLGELGRALRTLRREPGFVAAAVVTLSLGIGANAAMFGVVDALMYRPPPGVGAPRSLVRVQTIVDPKAPKQSVWFSGFTLSDLAAVAGPGSPFATVAGYASRQLHVGPAVTSLKSPVILVNGDYFRTLRATVALGRPLLASDDMAAATPVAVVSDAYWRRSLGADPAAIGRTLHVGDADLVVVGVANPEFVGMDLDAPDAWLPLAAAPTIGERIGPDDGALNIAARLRPGVSAEVAQARATAILRAQDAARPSTLFTSASRLVVLGDAAHRIDATRGSSPVPAWLLGATIAVLLVACANVVSLMLARAERRRLESAVRVAIGAGAWRLAREAFAESALLAAAGAIGGVFVAAWSTRLVQALSLPPLPGLLSSRVVLVTSALALLAMVLSGVGPALSAGRVDPAIALGAGRVVPRRGRARAALSVIQIAVTLVLLVTAGLFGRSLRNAREAAVGYDLGHTLIVSVDLSSMHLGPDEANALLDEATHRLRQLPAVRGVARAAFAPFSGMLVTQPTVAGVAPPPDRMALGNSVGVDYFSTAGIRLRSGRAFTAAEIASDAEVVVLNEHTARAFFPDGDALGRCITVFQRDCSRVVGIAENVHSLSLTSEDGQFLYVPLTARAAARSTVHLVVRTTGDPSAVLASARAIVQSADARMPYVSAAAATSFIEPQLAAWRIVGVAFGVFGVLAMLLAVVGLYAVVAYTVAQRTREVGIRMALGALGADVVRLVLGEGARVTALGILIGIAGAVAVGHVLRARLYGVGELDPPTYVAVAVLLAAAALLASWLPARRAARVDPAVALRAE